MPWHPSNPPPPLGNAGDGDDEPVRMRGNAPKKNRIARRMEAAKWQMDRYHKLAEIDKELVNAANGKLRRAIQG